jgi:hypothetical protein
MAGVHHKPQLRLRTAVCQREELMHGQEWEGAPVGDVLQEHSDAGALCDGEQVIQRAQDCTADVAGHCGVARIGHADRIGHRMDDDLRRRDSCGKLHVIHQHSDRLLAPHLIRCAQHMARRRAVYSTDLQAASWQALAEPGEHCTGRGCCWWGALAQSSVYWKPTAAMASKAASRSPSSKPTLE